MKLNKKISPVLIGMLIGFVVGVLFIPLVYLIKILNPVVPKFIMKIIVFFFSVIYYNYAYLGAIDDVFIHSGSILVLFGIIIPFYTFIGLIIGAIYQLIRKKSKLMAKIMTVIFILLFLAFNFLLYLAGPPG